jgi:4-hydroxymandelate oxidase
VAPPSAGSRPAGNHPSGNRPAADLEGVVSLRELEALARDCLPEPALDYVAGGSWDEVTLRENGEAFRRRRFRARVLSGVRAADLSTTLLGRPVAMPLGVAPMSQHGFCHPDGELASARAAAAAGWTFALSTLSTRSLEEVAQAADGAGEGRRWFQLYLQEDLAFSRSLVERAAAAGYDAIVVTVDLPVLGYRDRDLRGTGLPLRYGNFVTPDGGDTRTIGRGHPPLTWALIDQVRGWSQLPVIVKGILVGDDARRAVDIGAAGVVVSNHGGRQLDRVPAAIDALPEVVAAVAGEAEVYLDSGVRRGLDVVLALALGARAVFIGRPILYGLAVGGETGVARALEIVRRETERAMVLLGAATVGDLGPHLVLPSRG